VGWVVCVCGVCVCVCGGGGGLQDGKTNEYIVGLSEKQCPDFNMIIGMIKRKIEKGEMKTKNEAVTQSADLWFCNGAVPGEVLVWGW
jgi:hypothetical protein